jgi:hypothetical protein
MITNALTVYSNRKALYVTRLAIQWSKFMRLSNRKKGSERFVAAKFSGFVKV